ncbi:MAG TPA: tripartite tricarboxylate transporter substrate binding protein [Xanthobacteraceae bacterium]|jgi:tripartite-type tricarboxylate transporter receptor subunit TctC|nr:tripartite tricarboxylate transporter substrate binding protein [Xanthobacteraceae bacterium]
MVNTVQLRFARCTRRHVVRLLAVVVLGASLGAFNDRALAEQADSAFPSQPIRMVIPAAPGGTLDVIARLVGQKLTDRLGQPVIIENKSGANTILGTEFVAKAKPDGYTLLCAAAASIVINPAIYANLRYSPADFAPLSNAASYPFILSVAKSVPAQNLHELIDYIKKNPEKANAGGSTAGHQLMTALFRQKTGAPLQYIPYRGMNEVVSALIGDQLMMSFLTASNAGQINSGLMRAIAVTSATRDPHFPNVPTTAEAGVEGLVAKSWAGFLAPANTPAPIVAKLSSEIAAILKLPEVRERLLAANLDPVGDSSEEFAGTIASDFKVWAEVAKTANIQISQ